MYFDIPADFKVKIKEKEKKEKYFELAKELRKLWNMKLTVIPVIIGALRTVPKGMERRLKELEIGERIDTIQHTALLRSGGILRIVLVTLEDFLSLRLQWKNIN